MDTSSSELAAWLVQTKLYPPRLRDDIVFRPRLHNALKQALNNYPLTLITAPPGYGKTTLLATLCRHKDDEAGGKMKTEKVLHPSALSLSTLPGCRWMRMTIQEVATWLNERLNLHVAADSLRLLQQRTEGWVTGIRLLALLEERLKDGAHFIAVRFPGTRSLGQ